MVTAGANTTVTGSGTASNPYVVSTTSTPVTVTDTNTVDLTLTGQDIQAAVKLDPVAGNLITATAQGLRVDCAAISACGPFAALTVTDTPSVDLTLSGAGTISSPWVLSAVAAAATPITNGNGIAPIVGGVVAACLSTDANNEIVFGSDGCLYAPSSTPITTLDTPSVDLTLTGGQLSADVIPDPSLLNVLTIGPAGLLVDVKTGCGLSGEGTAASPLIVDTNAAVWPFACPQSNGAPVYCDPVTGGLHVDPQQDRRVLEADLTSVAGTMELNAIGVPIGGAPAVFGPTLAGTFTNPNPCRDMVVIVNGGVKHFNMRADTGGRAQFQYGLQLTLTGPAAGVYSPNGSHVQFMADGNRNGADPNWDFIWDTVATTQIAQFILPAGASFNWTMQGIGQLTNYNGDSQVGTLQAFAHFDGQTI